ncbi:SDR family oxidoreductase [Cupriavidus plantarum]|uniref:SDR family oxidoreductase n=1 Tax=Cupriavidus plantarum TaxID=942865 RepID=UPI00215B201B|nr:SDR family oxidoreductase [Cupriavidus plantarum]
MLGDRDVHVIAGVRRPDVADVAGASEYRAVDLARLQEAPAWSGILSGVDAVVNLVGIFRETPEATFDVVQRVAPIALFAACRHAGIARVVQLSALGADDAARTPFLRTKHAADQALLSGGLEGIVLQPSLVYGDDGQSSGLFRTLAAMPVAVLPDGGRSPVQPIHVDDVAAAVASALLRPMRGATRRCALVGPAPMPFRDYLATLRRGMGFRSHTRVIPVPLALARGAAAVAERLPGALISRDAVDMLARGNAAPAGETKALLGRAPRAADTFIDADRGPALGIAALMGWIAPLLRWSVAFLWIVTAAVSLGLYPIADSLALLERAGVPAALRPFALYGAALLDLLLGVLTVLPRRPRWLWLAQIALILGYTAIISVRLPEFWLHPYGPLTKNIPLLALLLLLDQLERNRWTTSR